MWKRLFTRKPINLLLEEMAGDNRLRRVLGPVALTSLGIGCVIGTGIFVLTGVGAHDKAGPALSLSFVVSGIACVFAALCYAEFASLVPVAGSAYTYAYASLGELFAWIIGWDLIIEYTIASASVAYGWSKYLQEFIGIFGLHIPKVLSNAPFDFNPQIGRTVPTGTWFDLPAIVIVGIVTLILVKGIRESAGINSAIVALKVCVVLFVIVVGAFFIKPENWAPFAPYGYTGVKMFGKTIMGLTGKGGEPLGMLAGAAIMFYAYIGFDTVSAHAEEAKNPQRDVPIGIIASLLICTILYIAVTVVLTGMVRYDQLDINAPVSNAFKQVGLPWAQFIVSLGAIAGITSVLLVLMLGQPRVLLAMARDGLLPRGFFGAVHDKFRTPWKSTILVGCIVATLAGIIPLRVLAELVNIGTLFAFVIVCLAVIVLRRTNPQAPRPFRCPWVPVVPILGVAFCLLLMCSLPGQNWIRLFVWLGIGLVVYAAYGYRNSVMRTYSPTNNPKEKSNSNL